MPREDVYEKIRHKHYQRFFFNEAGFWSLVAAASLFIAIGVQQLQRRKELGRLMWRGTSAVQCSAVQIHSNGSMRAAVRTG
jgi:hypothetical protein